MSQHPSLKGKGAIKAKRSVLKRFERVEVMKKRGQFKEGQRVIGLPKTKPEELAQGSATVASLACAVLQCA